MTGAPAGLQRGLVSRWADWPFQQSFAFRLCWRGTLRGIRQRQRELQPFSDEQLQRSSLSLRYRAFCGEPPRRLLTEAYALMREACGRALGMEHYEVQLLGGIALADASIAEMQTGEGKTLTAALPLYLAALYGRGAHLATANDYLAGRDAEYVRPAFELLGMNVGVIESATARPQRQHAYGCDVTYSAAREFGFDFLRDRLLLAERDDGQGDLFGRMLGHASDFRAREPLQRDPFFMLVDEADSILIDEARTPLIISALPGDSPESAAALYGWAAEVTAGFHAEEHYEFDLQTRKLSLTAAGRRRVRELSRPSNIQSIPLYDLYLHVERALRVELEFQRDRNYVVRDDEIVIVDESTGRLAEGRKWRDGIHQAVEAREGLPISVSTAEAARVTVQDYFRRYPWLSGMTGTAASARRELQKIYQLTTRVIPTHRRSRREAWAPAVFPTEEEKWRAIVAEVAEVQESGRPVLIGTRTIEHSESLSFQLTAAGIDHEVLNAHRHAEEAAVVAEAGYAGKVTVATNMAGRGTDIQLGPGVEELGGLHVICSELHESERIDRQLIGRCARQGDPGSYRQFMSLEDDLLRAAFGPRKSVRLRNGAQDVRGQARRYIRLLRNAQTRVAIRQFRQRKMLMYHEKRRRELQREMGQDPFLDAAS